MNKHLLAACSRVAEVKAICSTHYYEDYDHEQFPYEIIGCDIVPINERSIEHQKNLARIEAAVDSLEWDIFFIQADMGWWNALLAKVGLLLNDHPEKHAIFYMPVDGDVSFPYAFDILKFASAPVVYTHHAKSVIAKYAPEIAKDVSVMWLGCETNVFYPLSEEERIIARLKLFGEAYLNQFLVINVNRNQVRKDLARCMSAFHQFHLKHPDSSLYLHSVISDAGGSLTAQAQMTGCNIEKPADRIVYAKPSKQHRWKRVDRIERNPAEVIFSGLDLANPWQRSTLNEMYNAADCLVSTAFGEGWGLTTTEAMCVGVPVVVPYNTANIDILGENCERGWGVKSGKDIDHTTFVYQNGGSPVAHIHADSFVKQLEQVYYHPEKAKAKAQIALEWCRNNTWAHREAEWEQLIQLIAQNQVCEEVLV